MPKSAQFLRRVAICVAAIWSRMLRRPRSGGGDVVVDGGDGAIGAADLAAGEAEALEGLRGGDLVDELQVDVEDGGLACGFDDDVLLPDFFEECFWCGAHDDSPDSGLIICGCHE